MTIDRSRRPPSTWRVILAEPATPLGRRPRAEGEALDQLTVTVLEREHAVALQAAAEESARRLAVLDRRLLEAIAAGRK